MTQLTYRYASHEIARLVWGAAYAANVASDCGPGFAWVAAKVIGGGDLADKLVVECHCLIPCAGMAWGDFVRLSQGCQLK